MKRRTFLNKFKALATTAGLASQGCTLTRTTQSQQTYRTQKISHIAKLPSPHAPATESTLTLQEVHHALRTLTAYHNLTPQQQNNPTTQEQLTRLAPGFGQTIVRSIELLENLSPSQAQTLQRTLRDRTQQGRLHAQFFQTIEHFQLPRTQKATLNTLYQDVFSQLQRSPSPYLRKLLSETNAMFAHNDITPATRRRLCAQSKTTTQNSKAKQRAKTGKTSDAPPDKPFAEEAPLPNLKPATKRKLPHPVSNFYTRIARIMFGMGFGLGLGGGIFMLTSLNIGSLLWAICGIIGIILLISSSILLSVGSSKLRTSR